jgi:hypothetical protein
MATTREEASFRDHDRVLPEDACTTSSTTYAHAAPGDAERLSQIAVGLLPNVSNTPSAPASRRGSAVG